jgi:two-component system OmpR family response regulator
MTIETVLLIDDEADIRRIAELSLSRVGGWRVVQAASGEAALGLARTEHPDLILLDFMMPKLDGSATIGRLKADAATRQIPVIFMTAKAHPEDVERCLALGAIGVITKPFDPLLLPDQVRRLLRGP